LHLSFEDTAILKKRIIAFRIAKSQMLKVFIDSAQLFLKVRVEVRAGITAVFQIDLMMRG
jgi:hypothetical protein